MENMGKTVTELEQELNKYKVLYRVLSVENDNLKYNYRALTDKFNEVNYSYSKITSNVLYRFFRKIYRTTKKIFVKK